MWQFIPAVCVNYSMVYYFGMEEKDDSQIYYFGMEEEASSANSLMYYIDMEDEAHTEDPVVKKLFLYNVSYELSVVDVQTHFERYGKVVHLYLFDGRPHAAGKTGFVIFANSRDAATALREPRHIVNEYIVSVDISTPPPIMTLNDDCIYNILQYLDVSDRVRFAKTCTRFKGLYEQIAPILNKSIDFWSFIEMSAWDTRNFFTQSGRRLEHIVTGWPEENSAQLSKYVGDYCTNLKTLSVYGNELLVQNIFEIFPNMTQLEEVLLRDCNLDDDSLLALTHLKHLKELDIANNLELTGVSMKYLPSSIECLSLFENRSFQPRYLVETFKALPKLRLLNMQGTTVPTTEFYDVVISRSANALEEILFSGSPNCEYEHLAKFPKLKMFVLDHFYISRIRPDLLTWMIQYKALQLEHLEIDGLNSITTGMMAQINKLRALRTLIVQSNNILDIQELAEIKLPHLEELDLTIWPNLTDEAVLGLVLSCPKLYVLRLGTCINLTGKLVHDIIFNVRQQMRENTLQRQLPIQLYIDRTKVSEVDKNHPDVAAKDIIDLYI